MLPAVTDAVNYTKMEVILMRQWDDRQVKTIKRRHLFSVPELEETMLLLYGAISVAITNFQFNQPTDRI